MTSAYATTFRDELADVTTSCFLCHLTRGHVLLEVRIGSEAIRMGIMVELE
jgi:hypothetical protein